MEDAELPGDVVVSRYSRQQATADAHDLLSRGASTDLTTVALHGSDLGRGATDSEWR